MFRGRTLTRGIENMLSLVGTVSFSFDFEFQNKLYFNDTIQIYFEYRDEGIQYSGSCFRSSYYINF